MNYDALGKYDGGKMRIGNEWIYSYIKKYGTKVIIPKEVTVISKFGAGIEQIGKQIDIKDGIEIIFEEGSMLTEIEDYAFRGCKIKNEILLPNSLKRIGNNAFGISAFSVKINEYSNLEECEDDIIFANQEIINVPPNLQYLYLSHCDNLKTLVIPKNAKIKCIKIHSIESKLQNIETNNGTISLDYLEGIRDIEIEDDEYKLIYQRRRERW